MEMLEMRSRDIRRFWKKVNVSIDCWEWSGLILRRYGVFWLNEGGRRAHRVAYHNFVVPVPSNLLVCHHCDNTICVRPDHLFLGTHSDNRIDCVSKRRDNSPWGEAHHMT